MRNYLLFFSLLTGSFTFSQDNISPGSKRTAETRHLRQTVIHLDGLDYDYRVLKYYSPDVLQTLPAAKRRQVHFLYTASYEVLNANACQTFDPLDIDVAALERFRKDEDPVIIDVGISCQVQVRLMSRAACRIKMEEVK